MDDNKHVFRAGEDTVSRKKTSGKNVFRADAVPVSNNMGAGKQPAGDLFSRVDALLADKPQDDAPITPAPTATPGDIATPPAQAPVQQGTVYARPDDPFSAFYGSTASTPSAAISHSAPEDAADDALAARIAAIRSQASGPVITAPGHMTQTTEIPILGSEAAKAADTEQGLYVELQDGGHPAVEIEAAQSSQGPATDMPPTEENLPPVAADSARKNIGETPAAPQADQPDLDEADDDAAQQRLLRRQQRQDARAERRAARVQHKAQADAPEVLPEAVAIDSKAKEIKKDEEKTDRKLFKNKSDAPTDDAKRNPSRAVTAMLVALLMLLITPLVLFVAGFRLVRIYDEDVYEKMLISRDTNAVAMVEQSGIEVHDHDGFTIEDKGVLRDIRIQRAIPVTIIADGKTETHYVLAKTVQEAVIHAGYSLDDDDELSLPHTDPISANGEITIYRVNYVERHNKETIPWQQVEKLSPLVPDGERVTMNSGGGKNGEGVILYMDKYIDGVYTESHVANIAYTDRPHDVIVLIGDSTAPMSPIDGARFTDIEIVDNVPASYDFVIKGGTCTAYSFNPGVYGSTGMYLFQGFVAVDPDVIPYGSLLYITSADGSFVYGWAIAADTGTAMVDGIVDVDCFFETYRESTLFGKHTMNIYVVGQLTQEDLEEFVAMPSWFDVRIPKDKE